MIIARVSHFFCSLLGFYALGCDELFCSPFIKNEDPACVRVFDFPLQFFWFDCSNEKTIPKAMSTVIEVCMKINSSMKSNKMKFTHTFCVFFSRMIRQNGSWKLNKLRTREIIHYGCSIRVKNHFWFSMLNFKNSWDIVIRMNFGM